MTNEPIHLSNLGQLRVITGTGMVAVTIECAEGDEETITDWLALMADLALPSLYNLAVGKGLARASDLAEALYKACDR